MSSGETLPSGWVWTNLSELGDWRGGGTPSKSNPEYWTDGVVPWVSPKDVKATRLSNTQDHVTELAVQETVIRKVPANSIVFVVRSGILAHTLPIALIEMEATVNQDIRALVPDADINADWLLYALLAESEAIRSQCQKDGTTVASIEVPALAKWSIALPPRQEQDRIVAEVERLRDELRHARSDLESARRDIDHLRHAILSRVIEGLPREPLGDIATDWRYGTSVKCSQDADGPPVLRIPNIRDGEIDTSDLKFATVSEDALGECVAETGDLLFVRTNGSRDLIGKVGLVRDREAGYAFASYLIRARPTSRLVPEWAVVTLSTPEIRAEIERLAASTAGQYNLNLASLRSLMIPLPDVENQIRLSAETDSWTRSLVELGQDLAEAAELGRQLDQGLLLKAQQGVLVAQNPRDEPAHVLLERIQAAHEERLRGAGAAAGRRKTAPSSAGATS